MEPGGQTGQLTEQEIEALAGAGAWYAKYHARIIAERADDRSAYAKAQRERYSALLSGLEKLGVRLRDPLSDAVAEPPAIDQEAA